MLNATHLKFRKKKKGTPDIYVTFIIENAFWNIKKTISMGILIKDTCHCKPQKSVLKKMAPTCLSGKIQAN